MDVSLSTNWCLNLRYKTAASFVLWLSDYLLISLLRFRKITSDFPSKVQFASDVDQQAQFASDVDQQVQTAVDHTAVEDVTGDFPNDSENVVEIAD